MALRSWRMVELLRPIWNAEARVLAVRQKPGLGLARWTLASLVLAITLCALMWVDIQGMLREAPGVIAQLPHLSIKKGELVATPPQLAPLILHNSQGREIAVLDLEGRTRLETRDAMLMVTRSRVLVKGGDGTVQAFPLGGVGGKDQDFSKEDLLAGVMAMRWLAVVIFLPLFYLFSLAVLAVEFGLVGMMALVPDLIYKLGLDAAGRLRLASLGLLPSTVVVSLCLVAGLQTGLPLLALGLSLCWVLLGAMALDGHARAGLKPGSDRSEDA